MSNNYKQKLKEVNKRIKEIANIKNGQYRLKGWQTPNRYKTKMNELLKLIEKKRETEKKIKAQLSCPK